MARPFIDAGPADDGEEVEKTQGATIHPALRELIEAAQVDRQRAGQTLQQAQAQAQQSQMQSAAMIAVALKALSQKALIALASLFTLLTCGSAFWLWMSIPEPTVTQLVGMGMYAVFILLTNLLVVWRKAQ